MPIAVTVSAIDLGSEACIDLFTDVVAWNGDHMLTRMRSGTRIRQWVEAHPAPEIRDDCVGHLRPIPLVVAGRTGRIQNPVVSSILYYAQISDRDFG